MKAKHGIIRKNNYSVHEFRVLTVVVPQKGIAFAIHTRFINQIILKIKNIWALSLRGVPYFTSACLHVRLWHRISDHPATYGERKLSDNAVVF